MVHYHSRFQLKFQNFGNLCQINLNAINIWILLGNALPWDKLVNIFAKKFSDYGRSSVDPRIVIVSHIIKHKLDLSDEDAVQLF